MQPLYGHTTQETAYLVRDYPYGFRLRCQIRYWLESDPKKGHRFCSQTTNPKKPGEVWNAPKKSTYTPISACMFLDDEDHVQWTGFDPYHADKALRFVETYAQAAGIGEVKLFVKVKVHTLKQRISGERFYTITGERQGYTEGQKESDQEELAGWEKVLAACERLGL